MKKEPSLAVTAIIHTRNADRYLQEVIDRLRDFDEIMVVDMESSDRTLEIAEANGCRIEKFPACGYVEPARDFAMHAAKNDWVFFVDADELVTPELVRWIREFVAAPGDVKGVLVSRRNCFLDSWRRDDYPDYQLRLIDSRFAMWPPAIHSRPEIQGKIGRVPSDRHELALIHKPPMISEVMERMNRYTGFELEKRGAKKVGILTLWLKPMFRFFKSFVLRGGFRSGTAGYIAAKNDSIYKHYALVKRHEAWLAEKEEKAR